MMGYITQKVKQKFSRLPKDEREEVSQLLADRLGALSHQERGFAIAEHRLNIQAKIRKHGGLITEDQAEEKIHETLVQGVPKLQRWALENHKTAFYWDLEKYRELPEIALAKHYSFNSFVQVVKEKQAEQQVMGRLLQDLAQRLEQEEQEQEQ
jgi:hypothetical protein